MLTDSLLSCVGKRVNVMFGHQTPQLLRGILVAAEGSFIEVSAGGNARRLPLAQVRSIEVG